MPPEHSQQPASQTDQASFHAKQRDDSHPRGAQSTKDCDFPLSRRHRIVNAHQDRHAGHQTYQISDRLQQLGRRSEEDVEEFAHRGGRIHGAGVLAIIEIVHQRLRSKGAARAHEDR